MKFEILFVLMFSFFSVFEAKGQNNIVQIDGSKQIIDQIRESFNSIHYLEIGELSGSFNHVLEIENRGIEFKLVGTVSLNYLTIEMPDGKKFNFNWRAEFGYQCDEFPLDYAKTIQITYIPLYIASVACLNRTVDISNEILMIPIQKESLPSKYGIILPEKLADISPSKGRNGESFWSGNDADKQAVLALHPGVSFQSQGLSEEFIDGLRRNIDFIRDSYGTSKEQGTKKYSQSGGKIVLASKKKADLKKVQEKESPSFFKLKPNSENKQGRNNGTVSRSQTIGLIEVIFSIDGKEKVIKLDRDSSTESGRISYKFTVDNNNKTQVVLRSSTVSPSISEFYKAEIVKELTNTEIWSSPSSGVATIILE